MTRRKDDPDCPACDDTGVVIVEVPLGESQEAFVPCPVCRPEGRP